MAKVKVYSFHSPVGAEVELEAPSGWLVLNVWRVNQSTVEIAAYVPEDGEDE